MKTYLLIALSMLTLNAFAISESEEVNLALEGQPKETISAAKDFLATENMEVFDKKRLKKLKKKFGVDGANEVYLEWIKSKNLTTNCSELIGSCDYYLCREQNKGCGTNGYYLAFGYQYCNQSFTQLSSQVSPKGQLWLKDVATCLQQKVESEISPDLACKEIKNASIDSHEACYKETNFCGQKFNDLLKVISMLSPELTKPKMVLLGLKIVKNCVF